MRPPLLLYAVALGARAISGLFYHEPAYPDSFYYVEVARALVAGRGFAIDFIWNFVDVGGRLPSDPLLPIPSNAHWMPLASLVQLPFLSVLGPTSFASWLPFALLGSLAAPLTWAIGMDAGLGRAQAAAAGLMAAMAGAVAPFLSQPDNFALFMPLGALALWLCSRGARGEARPFALGGLAVGLAALARNDGLLLAVPFALLFLRDRWRAVREPGARPVIPLRAAAAWLGLFLLVMGPWYLRQLTVFGSLTPSAASGRILWITSYPQLFSVTSDASLTAFLAQDPAALLASRAEGFGFALLLLAALPLLLFLTPFVVWGAWHRRRSPSYGPWLAYAAALIAASGLLFAVHVRYGTFLHSAVALLPHAYLASVEGIALAASRAARYRPGWQIPRASRNFSFLAAAVVWFVGMLASARMSADWALEAAWRRDVGAFLAGAASPGDRLMSPNPGGYRYDTGFGGVVTPEDPLETVEAVARGYDVRWLVLERNHSVVSLADVFLGKVDPEWLSAPVFIVPERSPAVGAPSDDPLPLAMVYAVCLEPAADPRPACHPASP